MKSTISIFSSGFLFALGLGIAGMTDANKVIGFLDIASGNWDPSLIVVLVSALLVHTVLYRLIIRAKGPRFGTMFSIPTREDINVQLIGGSVLFGAGWGLAGFCPGPSIVSLATLQSEALLFFASMVGGMFIFHYISKGKMLEE